MPTTSPFMGKHEYFEHVEFNALVALKQNGSSVYWPAFDYLPLEIRLCPDKIVDIPVFIKFI